MLLPGFVHIACSILVLFLFSFFSTRFVIIHVVELTKPLMGRNCVLFYRISLFHMIDNLSIAVHAFTRCILITLTYLPIIIMSCDLHGYPWPSLATPPYCQLLPAGLQGYIPYWHRAAVCSFGLLVLLLLVLVKRSTGVHHLWACPYFSSSVPHVWFV